MAVLKTKTKKDEVMDKKTKIAELQKTHSALFKKLKVSTPLFIPKMSYFDSTLRETVISLFESEIKEENIYTEFVSRDYDSEDETRTLYMWKYNPFFKTEYKKTEPHPTTGHIRYIIPVSELLIAKELVVDEIEDDIDIPNPDLDLPMDQMTMRDYACIKLQTPQSFKPWLNELIKKI